MAQRSSSFMTFTLLGVFAVLLALVVFVESDWADRRVEQKNIDAPRHTENIFEGGDRVDIVNSSGSYSLLENDSGWTISGIDSLGGDEKTISDFLRELSMLSVGRRVSRSSDAWDKYGVVEDGVSHVRVFKGEQLLSDIVMGSYGPSRNERYFRLDEGSEVFLIGGNVADFLVRSAVEWRSLALVGVEESEATKVVVRLGEEKTTLMKDTTGGVWILETDEGVDKDEDKRLQEKVEGLFGLLANEIPDGENFKEVQGLEPFGKLYIERVEGSAFELKFYEKDGKVLGLRNDAGVVFRLGDRESVEKRLKVKG